MTANCGKDKGGELPNQTAQLVHNTQPPKSCKTKKLRDKVVFAHNVNKLAGLPT